MTRWLTAVLGSLFLAGCPMDRPPEPPAPPRPIVVEQDDRDVPEGTTGDVDTNEEQTRQRALVVMASEQRTIVNQLEQQTRFVRVDTRTTQRVRNALVASERELSSIDEGLRLLGLDDSLSSEERRARQADLKERLRRLASRLALMETALREG